jgi:hypothetical protein
MASAANDCANWRNFSSHGAHNLPLGTQKCLATRITRYPRETVSLEKRVLMC